jgi:hypothetical protein
MTVDTRRIVDVRFRLVRRIHEGRAGPVWEAEDLGWPGSLVWLQFLTHPALTDPEDLATTLKGLERLTWPWFTHPNLIKVYRVGRHGSTGFVVTEVIRGEPLSDRLDAEPVDQAVRLRMLAAVSSAVHAAQSAGVRFGELRAEDVVLTPTSLAKVAFLGLLAPHHDESSTTDVVDRSAASALNPLRKEVLGRQPEDDSGSTDAVGQRHVMALTGPRSQPRFADRNQPVLEKPDGRIYVHAARWADPLSPGPSMPSIQVARRRVLALVTLGILIVAGLGGLALLTRGGPNPIAQPVAPGSPSTEASIGAPTPSPFAPGPSPQVAPSPSTQVTVPTLVGLTVLQARTALVEQGLRKGVTVPTAGVPGLISRTDPNAGAQVEPGTKVTVFVGVDPDRLAEDAAGQG